MSQIEQAGAAFGKAIATEIAALRGDMAEMRGQMATKAELAEVRAEMATKAELAKVRAEMATKTELAEVRAEMATKTELAEVRSDIARLERLTLNLIDAVNTNTVMLREELNSQFKLAGLNVRLSTAPRKKA